VWSRHTSAPLTYSLRRGKRTKKQTYKGQVLWLSRKQNSLDISWLCWPSDWSHDLIYTDVFFVIIIIMSCLVFIKTMFSNGRNPRPAERDVRSPTVRIFVNNCKIYNFIQSSSQVQFLMRSGDFLFNWPNPSRPTMALRSTQPLTEMSTRNLNVGNGQPTILCIRLTTSLPSVSCNIS
jgi:hypothetical protein